MQCGQRSSGAPYGTGWADDEGDDDGGGGSSGQLESRRREPEGKGQAPATKTRQEQEVGRLAESKARQGKARRGRQHVCLCVLCRLSGLVRCRSGAGATCTMCYFEHWPGTELGACGVWVLR